MLLLGWGLWGVACTEEPGGRSGDASADRSVVGQEAGSVDTGGAADNGGGTTDTSKRDSAAKPDSATTVYTCSKPHPDWLFCDDFEGMAKGIDAWYTASGWTENIGKSNAGRMTSSTQAHGGKYAVHYPAAASAGYQGADLIWRPCAGANKAGCKPLLGYKQLYLRTWVKLATDHKKVHHFLSVGGGPLDDYWAPYGNSGCRPNGKRGMGTTVESKPSTHATYFYSYFPAMTCDAASKCSNAAQVCADCAKKDMPCTNGLECCWGKTFAPSPEVKLPLGKWFCVEMMMKANDVGQKNGEMAYWVDGKLGHQVKQMQWRTVSTLQLNRVRLQHYLTTGDAGGHSNRVWFDDVVVSTKPIGCK
jgi:hypothetical protein